MFNLTITEDDIKRNTMMDPTWYLVEIEKAEEKTSSAGDSTNLRLDLKVISDEKGATKFAGMPLVYFANEKAAWAQVNLIAALHGGKAEPGNYALDPATLPGRKLLAFVRPLPNQNDPAKKLQNTITDWKKVA